MKITYIKTGKRVKPKSESKHFVTKQRSENRANQIRENSINQSEKENKNNQAKNIKKFEFSKNEAFKTIFRKNQIVLLTLALMLVTAGYMNYNNSNNELNISLAELGDAQLVSSNVADSNATANTNAGDTNKENNTNEEKTTNTNSEGNAVETNNSEEAETNNNEANGIAEANSNGNVNTTTETNSNGGENSSSNVEVNSNQDYYTQTRLERQTMYSQMLEAYQKILENEKIPTDQKTVASNEIKNINDRINAISIAENLIKTKGFEDVILLINDNNINVVVKQKDKLSDEQVAQITNIVSRELKAEIGDIHITMK